MINVSIRKGLLEGAIATRLEHIWNQADRLPSTSPECEAIVDEVLYWRGLVRENGLHLPIEVLARF